MKATLRLIPIFLLLFCVGGCKKDDATAVVPTEKDPVITVTANTLNPDYDGSCTVSWEVTGNYESFIVKLNNTQISVDAKSSYTFNSITAIQYLNFICTTQSGKQVNKDITITPKSPLPVLPTVTLTADKLTIIPGDSLALYWDAKNSINDSLTIATYTGFTLLNSVTIRVDSVGSMSFSPTVTTLYTIMAWNKDGQASASVEIVVTLPPPPKTNMDYISAHPWTMESSVKKYYEEDPWSPEGIYPGEKNIFHNNNVWEIFSATGVLIGNGNFSINQTNLVWGATYKIIQLNDTVMTIKTKVVCYSGCPVDSVILQNTYKSFVVKSKR